MNRVFAFLIGLACGAAAGAEPAKIDYHAQVAPIFKKYCVGCHNPDDHEGKLSLRTYEQLLAGGKHGAVVSPGKPDQSRMVLVLTGKAKPAMPPEDNEKPTAAEIAALEAWIAAGAKGPDGAAPDPTVLVTPKVEPKGQPADSVTAVACSPDGSQWAVARYGAVDLLKTADRSSLRRLTGHRGRVNAVCFARVGSMLAAAAGEPGLFGEVRLWNSADGKPLRTLQGHQDCVYAVAISPGGDLVATGSYDQQIKIWDAATGKELRTLAGHNDAVYDLAFRADGKVLASASGDRTVKLWNVADGARLDTLSQPLKELYAVAFSPDGSRVAAGGVDNRIRVWQVSPDAKENSNPIVYSRFAHEGAILKLVFSADGRTLVSSADDRTVKVWNAETLTQRATLEAQSDWAPALAITPDSKTLLVGRLDGTVGVYDLEQSRKSEVGSLKPHSAAHSFSGRPWPPLGFLLRAARLSALALLATEPTPPAAASPPTKPELAAVSLRGIQRGATARAKCIGKNLNQANQVKSSHEKLAVKLVAAPTKPDEVEIELAPAADVPRGRYEVWLVSPAGDSARQAIWVDDLPQIAEVEPNDSLLTATEVAAPSGAWGRLADKGDVDHFRFAAKAGQTIVLEVSAAAIGSKANPQITLFDPQGRVVAGNNDFDDGADPLLAYTIREDGSFTVQVSDQTLAGSGEHFYRLSLGAFPFVTAVYPLSVPANSETQVELCGFNLSPGAKAPVRAGAGREADVPLDPNAYRSRRTLKVLVGGFPEVLESEPNDSPALATPLSVPGTAGGRIWGGPDRSGDVDLFRFDAKAGQALVVEIEAARRGSPVDTTIEILHADGRPVERAWLQAVRDSYITFRGIDAVSRDVRLVNWEEMQLNELLYMNGEVCKLFRAPQGPDSGFVLYEGDGGKRQCWFDTSPAAHALDEPSYIVVPHPPGTQLAANGLPVFRLHYANDDDGQRRLGSDSRLTFVPPADGAYLVRVRDARGFAGDRFAYRLTVRPARPDFSVSLSGAGPTVGAGSGKAFGVSVDRIDGFDGDVRVQIGGTLPPGFSATPELVIQAGHRVATGVLVAAADAPQPTEQNWSHSKVTATATVDGKEVTKEVNNLGRIALAAKPKVTVRLAPIAGASEIVIAPGTRTPALLKIERAGFDGLVNLEVNNLPHGVIVDDIGLNAVQILEGQTERQIFLHCDAWVPDTSRSIHAVAKAEGDQASPAVLFRVQRPSPAAAR